jgi:hypothetical protein
MKALDRMEALEKPGTFGDSRACPIFHPFSRFPTERGCRRVLSMAVSAAEPDESP